MITDVTSYLSGCHVMNKVTSLSRSQIQYGGKGACTDLSLAASLLKNSIFRDLIYRKPGQFPFQPG